MTQVALEDSDTVFLLSLSYRIDSHIRKETAPPG